MRPDRIVIGADDERAIALLRARLRAVPAQSRAAAGHGHALGRAHQVRGQRDARDAHLVHERAGQSRRRARRRHRARAPGHRLGSAHRLSLPLSGRRLRRLVLPQGREGAAAHRRASTGCPLRILAAVEAVNEAQKTRLVDKIVARLGEDLAGKTFALWGLAFKPNTDDMREAPSRAIIAGLARARRVRCCLRSGRDGRGAGACSARRPGLSFASSPMAAVAGADALVIVTEWKEFRSPDFAEIRRQLQAASALRRPQSVRPGAGARRGPRVLRDRPQLGPSSE